MDILITVITAIISGAASSTAFVFLAKSLITERLKGAIKGEYDIALENFKNITRRDTELILHDKKVELELTILNSTHALELQKQEIAAMTEKLAVRDSVRFTKLHETRFAPLYETWEKLRQLRSAANFYFFPYDYADENDRMCFYTALREARLCVEKYTLYFSKTQISDCIKFIDIIGELSPEPNDPDEEPFTEDLLIKIYQKQRVAFKTNVPEQMNKIEEDFRILLGVDS